MTDGFNPGVVVEQQHTSSSKTSSCCSLLCGSGRMVLCPYTPASTVICSSSSHFMVRPGRNGSGGSRNRCRVSEPGGKQAGAGRYLQKDHCWRQRVLHPQAWQDGFIER